MDLNYDTLHESEIFPSVEIDDYLKKRIYLPQVENKIYPFKFDHDHMSQEQTEYFKTILIYHKGAINTPEAPLGNY